LWHFCDFEVNYEFSDLLSSAAMYVLGGCKVSAGSDSSLQITAQFLGCNKAELNAALVSRVMQTPVGGRRGSEIMYVY